MPETQWATEGLTACGTRHDSAALPPFVTTEFNSVDAERIGT